MPPPLLTLHDISIRFGETPLFAGVELMVSKGERLCLVGRNGAGKSTLLRIAAGAVEPDRGRRFLQPGCQVAYLPQEPAMADDQAVAAFVAGGLAKTVADSTHRVEAMLAALRLDGGAPLGRLSGGEARRAALAQALVGRPDILLLDEPTNHLDLPTIEWLEAELSGYRGSLILVSHDRAFLNRLTRACLWLDRGRVRRLDQGFAAFQDWSEQILAAEAEARRKLDKRIQAETRWSVEGITARRRRNQGRLRRLARMRAERAERLSSIGRVKLAAASGALSGRLVVQAESIAKSFDGRAIVTGFSTRIMRGDRIGVIGRNGVGKTTLLRMLTGGLAPDCGRVRLGANLTPAYLDQNRAALDSESTVWATLCPGGGDQVMVQGRPRHVVSYLRDFLFAESQALSPVGALSGGERNRLLLAQALARPSNFLILDEPTNDLDIDTLELLQEMLADYDGTLLLVSHDRDFLDRVVTSTIALEGDGHAVEYPGGYSDYVRMRPPPTPTAPAKGRKRMGEPAPGRRRPTKLGYHQQRALAALPERIAALTAEIAQLEGELAETELFARAPAQFQQLAARLEEAKRALAAAEDEWLEIELLRERLGE